MNITRTLNQFGVSLTFQTWENTTIFIYLLIHYYLQMFSMNLDQYAQVIMILTQLISTPLQDLVGKSTRMKLKPLLEENMVTMFEAEIRGGIV